MGRLAGKVAVISGAARGQGREHARLLAREGADIVAFDICAPLKFPDHPGSSIADLKETGRAVETEGRRCLTAQVDARDLPALRDLADRAMAEFGKIDILVVNHGIWVVAPNSWELEEDSWQESIDVLMTGAWKVTAAFIPKILAGGSGGSIILTSSAMGTKPQPGAIAYTVAKHGVIGIMRTLAWELGEHGVRVNAISPGSIATKMSQEGGTVDKSLAIYPRFFAENRSLLPVGWMPPDTTSKAVVFLASDDSEYITGIDLNVDAGWTNF